MKLRAFTLIETILYLGLFNIIFFAVITFTISMTQNNRSAEYKNAVEKNVMFTTEHIKDSFSKGLSVDQANSVFSSNPGKVRVTFASGYNEYSISSGKLVVTNGTNTFELTDRFVIVPYFYVEPVTDATSNIVGAKVTMTVMADKYPTLTKTTTTYYAFR